jgi:F-type H+-transporting ATPase subunit b
VADLDNSTGMQLTPDYSIFIQVALFIAVWLGLKTLVFAPMQRVLAERDRRTVQAEHSAREQALAAEADRVRYDEGLRAQRQRMMQEAESARHAAIAESNDQIATARAAISRELAHQRAEVAAQVDAARRALADEAERVAAEMLARVSGAMRA